MKITDVQVEYWPNEDNTEHIARCARLCYDSKPNNAVKMLNALKSSGHTSMFRHGTMYWKVPIKKCPKLRHADYICVVNGGDGFLYISANLDWCMYSSHTVKELWKYQVDESELLGTKGEQVIRRTFCVTTLISVSRELNRVSPNNIAEQSTRYVDFGKRGGITIGKPYWYEGLSPFKRWVARAFWKIDEVAYNLFKRWGLKAEDAREFLPLCSATKVAYTYTLKEWLHIIDLRYWETTGKAHSNAKLVAGMIRESLVEQGFKQFNVPTTEKTNGRKS